MKRNNKGFFALGMALGILVLATTVFLFVKYQQSVVLNKTQTFDNIIVGNINTLRDDIKTKQREGKQLTNYKLTNFGTERYDDGSVNDYNIIDKVKSNNNIDKVQFIDRVMTNRRKSLEFLGGKKTPDKIDSTFLIDLTQFVDSNNNNVGFINDLTLSYGTSLSNTPNMYILMVRIKKDKNIILNKTFETGLSDRKFGNNISSYGRSGSATDAFSINFKKINGKTSGSCTIIDKDLNIKWCNKITFNDFLSNDSFNLNNYFYKIYLVFAGQKNLKDKTVFKVNSANGNFGVGNFKYNDLTLLTGDNTKKRFIIESSSKKGDGGVIPYVSYSLWVNGEIKTK